MHKIQVRERNIRIGIEKIQYRLKIANQRVPNLLSLYNYPGNTYS